MTSKLTVASSLLSISFKCSEKRWLGENSTTKSTHTQIHNKLMAELKHAKKRFHIFIFVEVDISNKCIIASHESSRWDVAWQYHSNTQFMATVQQLQCGKLASHCTRNRGTHAVPCS